MNPFKYGSIVLGKDFCGRKDLLKQIAAHMEASQNIVIVGERRIGKSSLVYEAVRKLRGTHILYTDLLGIKSVDAFCKRILKTIVILERKASWMTKIIQTLSYLKPMISVDPITSMPVVTFDASVELEADSIQEVLDLIESLVHKKRFVVVFDEFQDVLNINDDGETIALLRSKIQFHSNIPYVFVGSIRHKMDEIFTSPNSAFFKSAIPITVDPLPVEEFSKFLIKKFESGKRKVVPDTLKRVFNIANKVTGDIQQLCEALWEVTSPNDTVSPDNLKTALELIFTREQKSYEAFISLLTDFQFKCLSALAREGGKSVYSMDFVKEVGPHSTASVNRAITRMIDINILFKVGKEIRFVNPFFKAWLLPRGR
jgi:Cdc6-like AAA superfamily ATPase